jgi:glucose-1-phosphate cytidylyltransferase
MNLNKFKKELTVIILCGGKGLRLRPITKNIPKPLIKINEKSILENIIRFFLKYKIKNFIIVTGYKHKLIDQFINNKFRKHNIRTLYTGLDADIIRRIEKASFYSKKYSLICYGDTMIDLNLNKYFKFYISNIKKVLIASYQLKSNFGILNIVKNDNVVKFDEKPILDLWFNVGYIIFSSEKFDYFKKFKKFQNLLKYLSKNKIMKAYKHRGKHITINTISELEKAKEEIKKFN